MRLRKFTLIKRMQIYYNIIILAVINIIIMINNSFSANYFREIALTNNILNYNSRAYILKNKIIKIGNCTTKSVNFGIKSTLKVEMTLWLIFKPNNKICPKK